MKISQGAEAVIYRDGNSVIKDRVKKSYRLDQIDDSLRKFRTRREAKVLTKLNELGFPVPKLLLMDDRDMKLSMQFLEGPKVRDVLHENYLSLGKEMGQLVGELHSNNIIHGDLTTSNMILVDKIHLIDFGLSFFSDKVEDKAVDLHLLRQALESKHYQFYEDAYNAVIEGYKEFYAEANSVLDRLQVVEKRGRNKGKPND